MNTDLFFSSESNEWETPQSFFNQLNEEFNFTLDPCSTHKNAKCKNHYTAAEDGLKQDWEGNIVFCNPPYGRQIKDWVKKCYEESLKPGTSVVMLIPARPDTKYHHEYIFPHAKAVLFIKGRLRFSESKDSAPFPSQLVIYSDCITESQIQTLNQLGYLSILR